MEMYVLTILVAAIVTAGVLAFRWPGPTVAVALVLTATVTFWALLTGEQGYLILWMLICLGLSLVTGSFAPQRTGEPDWGRTLARILLGFGVVCGAALGTFVLLGGLTLILGVLAAWLTFRYLLAAREALAMNVFSTLAGAMRQNMPLHTALVAEAQIHSGKYGRILGHIAEGIEQGLPLSRAVKEGYPGCPGFAAAALSAGERLGRPAEATQRVLEQIEQRLDRKRSFQPVNPAYPVGVLFAVVLVLLFLRARIAGRLAFILADMGSDLSPYTRFLLGLSEPATTIMLGIALAIVVVFPLAVCWRFRARTPDRPRLSTRVADAIRWVLPLTRWFERRRAVMQVAETIHAGIKAGQPIDRAVDAAGELDVNLRYRRRLLDWLGRIVRGEDVAEAARRSGVGEQIAWAFDQDVNPAGAPAALEVIASACRADYNYRLNIARCIAWPLVILTLAAFVGAVVYAAYLPLLGVQELTVQGVQP